MNDNRTKIVELDLNDVLPNRFQPRIVFNEDSIAELSESIKEHGVLQAIIVRPIGDKYEIIAGERRYKASVLAGLKTIPSVILDLNDKDSAEIALIENVQRRDLTPIEEALSIKKILDMGYITQEQLATKLGRSQSAIANKIRLLNLCDEVQEALMEGKISERHARSLLKISSSSDQKEMLEKIVNERLTVRKLDEEIEKFLKNGKEVKDKKDLTKNEEVLDTDDNKTNTSIENKKIYEEKKEQSNILKEETSYTSDQKIDVLEGVKFGDKIDKITDTLESDDKNLDENFLNNSTELDLSDLFIPLIPFDEKVNEDESEKDDKNNTQTKEKGEKDNMNNNDNKGNIFSSSFNFGNDSNDNTESEQTPLFQFNNDDSSSTNDFMKDKMKDLMAPQGSSPVFQTPSSFNQDSIFINNNPLNILSQNDSKEETTLNILPDNSATSQKQEEDQPQNSMFFNLMKELDNENETIDKNSLNQFLDPKFIDGEIKEQSELSQNEGMDTSVFAKFLDPDYGGEKKQESVESKPKVENSSFDIFNKPFQLSNEKENILNPTEKTSNNDVGQTLNNSIFNSPQVMSEPIITVEPEIIQKEDQNKTEELKINTPQNTESAFMNNIDEKPDLLAAMPVDTMTSSQVKEDTNKLIPSLTSFFSKPPVTEDNETAKADTIQEDNISNNEEDIKQSVPPVFITSSESIEDSIPSTPIIDDPNMSKLLATNETAIGPSVSEKEEALENEIVSENIEPVIDEEPININTQPIIITDYNKQYDPVLPQKSMSTGPQVDFKQVLTMIRNLNDQIESYGYTIDTDEIDLEDKYQVIFNIIKK